MPDGPWVRAPRLMVYAVALADGMHVRAEVYRLRVPKGVDREVLFDHTWHPSEVTELAVVEWAQRALARWLETQLLPETD